MKIVSQKFFYFQMDPFLLILNFLKGMCNRKYDLPYLICLLVRLQVQSSVGVARETDSLPFLSLNVQDPLFFNLWYM